MDRTKEIVEDVVLEAGDYINREFGKRIDIEHKGKIDLVTNVDLQSEEMITRALQEAFPEDDLLAEERGFQRKGKSSRLWLVDPLDGTTNFAHGFPFVSISVALEIDGTIVFAVVYNPVIGEYFEAEKDKGATLNKETIHVSENAELQGCLFSTGFPYDIQEHPEGHMERLGRVLMTTQGIRRGGSAAIDLCYVACGRFDAFYEKKLAPWDTAAGKLVVEEAGGRISTFGGDAYTIYGREILATNGLIHEKTIEILKG